MARIKACQEAADAASFAGSVASFENDNDFESLGFDPGLEVGSFFLKFFLVGKSLYLYISMRLE